MYAIEEAFPGLPGWRGKIFLRDRRQGGEEKTNCGERERNGFHGRRNIVTVMVSFDPKIGASGRPGTGSSVALVSCVAEREALRRLPSSNEIVFRESA